MARRMNMHELMGGEEEEGELNLTPYLDIITTLVIFMIFTFQVVIEFQLIDVFVPAYGKGGGGQSDKPKVTLTVIIQPDRFRVITNAEIAPEEILKKPDGDYDYDKLQETLVTFKDKLDMGESMILMADEKIEYKYVVQVMDAVRNDGNKLLFPDVALAAVGSK